MIYLRSPAVPVHLYPINGTVSTEKIFLYLEDPPPTPILATGVNKVNRNTAVFGNAQPAILLEQKAFPLKKGFMAIAPALKNSRSNG